MIFKDEEVKSHIDELVARRVQAEVQAFMQSQQQQHQQQLQRQLRPQPQQPVSPEPPQPPQPPQLQQQQQGRSEVEQQLLLEDEEQQQKLLEPTHEGQECSLLPSCLAPPTPQQERRLSLRGRLPSCSPRPVVSRETSLLSLEEASPHTGGIEEGQEEED